MRHAELEEPNFIQGQGFPTCGPRTKSGPPGL